MIFLFINVSFLDCVFNYCCALADHKHRVCWFFNLLIEMNPQAATEKVGEGFIFKLGFNLYTDWQ